MAAIVATPPVSTPPADLDAADRATAVAPRRSVAPFVAALVGAVAAVAASEWIVTAFQLHMHI